MGVVQTEEPVSAKVRPQFEIIDEPRPAVVEIDDRVGGHLNDFVVRAVCVLRWRRGSTGHPNPIVSTRGLQWSDDGEDWRPVPGDLHLSFEADIPYLLMRENIRKSVLELVRAGKTEPIGHELFQEAWHQRANMPRSALILGMTAAEVGVKAFIGDLVPDAEWLALNAPTPPLTQMLTEYLPKLPVRQRFSGVDPFVPKEILDTLKKGVNLRNKAAHAGVGVKADTLKKILIAVRDLLYLLDFYAGQAWAWGAISHEAQQLIDAEIAKQAKG